MHYLGALRGTGVLTCDEQTVGDVDYDFEGFVTKPGQVTGSGEIRMPPELLQQVFGQGNVRLLTGDGRKLDLRFSEKQLDPTSDAAHVDVTGGLPPAAEWRH